MVTNTPEVECVFLSRDELSDCAQRCLLAVNADSLAGVHVVSTGLKNLGEQFHVEAWLTDKDVDYGVADELRWSTDGTELFLSCPVSEHQGLREGTRQAYRSLLKYLDGLDHWICRIWNYIPGINVVENGSERYWQFNEGRRTAFREWQWPEHQFPAACALGGNTGIVYLQATRHKLLHVENPDQISAYHYPNKYGPSSPSFARATVVHRASQCSRIYISGTASIVGHQSLHADELSGQLAKTVSNIDALLDHVVSETGRLSATPHLLKVYIRRAEDFDVVRSFIANRFPGVFVQYLLADVCRKELLVEIEGLAELR